MLGEFVDIQVGITKALDDTPGIGAVTSLIDRDYVPNIDFKTHDGEIQIEV